MSTPPPPDPSTWKLPRLRIARDATWFHDDAEVTHEGIIANLRENLAVDEQGHYLRIGPVRVPVEVEDTPFVIVRVEREGDGLVVTSINGRSETRTYAKGVKGGVSDQTLSPEEEQVIGHAMRGSAR